MTRFEKFFIYSMFLYAFAILAFAFVLYRSISVYQRFEETVRETAETPKVIKVEIKEVK